MLSTLFMLLALVAFGAAVLLTVYLVIVLITPTSTIDRLFSLVAVILAAGLAIVFRAYRTRL